MLSRTSPVNISVVRPSVELQSTMNCLLRYHLRPVIQDIRRAAFAISPVANNWSISKSLDQSKYYVHAGTIKEDSLSKTTTTNKAFWLPNTQRTPKGQQLLVLFSNKDQVVAVPPTYGFGQSHCPLDLRLSFAFGFLSLAHWDHYSSSPQRPWYPPRVVQLIHRFPWKRIPIHLTTVNWRPGRKRSWEQSWTWNLFVGGHLDTSIGISLLHHDWEDAKDVYLRDLHHSWWRVCKAHLRLFHGMPEVSSRIRTHNILQ